MKYIFLAGGIWNTFGGLNFLFRPEAQAQAFGMPVGNRWELHFIGLVAFTFAGIYFSFFKNKPQQEYLYQVILFGLCKVLLFFSGLYCYFYYAMPFAFMIIFSGGNLVVGSLFLFYAFYYRKRPSSV